MFYSQLFFQFVPFFRFCINCPIFTFCLFFTFCPILYNLSHSYICHIFTFCPYRVIVSNLSISSNLSILSTLSILFNSSILSILSTLFTFVFFVHFVAFNSQEELFHIQNAKSMNLNDFGMLRISKPTYNPDKMQPKLLHQYLQRDQKLDYHY